MHVRMQPSVLAGCMYACTCTPQSWQSKSVISEPVAHVDMRACMYMYLCTHAVCACMCTYCENVKTKSRAQVHVCASSRNFMHVHT
jgi:hypothetical protein